MIFIVFKPIIVRDAFYSTINRRKEPLLVPTLCAAVGECLHGECLHGECLHGDCGD